MYYALWHLVRCCDPFLAPWFWSWYRYGVVMQGTGGVRAVRRIDPFRAAFFWGLGLLQKACRRLVAFRAALFRRRRFGSCCVEGASKPQPSSWYNWGFDIDASMSTVVAASKLNTDYSAGLRKPFLALPTQDERHHRQQLHGPQFASSTAILVNIRTPTAATPKKHLPDESLLRRGCREALWCLGRITGRWSEDLNPPRQHERCRT